jgi:chromosome segregation ATPase
METRAEREAYEEDMNFQLQEHRDELSKAKLQVADLSGDLQAEREQLQQVQDMHTNDMNILSERWTLHRQQLQEQISMMSNEIEELRKENEDLTPQIQELLALREEDEQRHHQEMTDLVAELEDKAVEIDRMAMELDQLRDVAGLLQAKDERIARLEDQVRQLELSRREADAVHDEMITRMKTVSAVRVLDFYFILFFISQTNTHFRCS